MEKIELYNRLTPTWFGIVAIKLGAGVLVGGAGLVGMARGNFDSSSWMTLGLGLLLLGFGLFDLLTLIDRKVQITLTPEGLLDHRMQRPVLVPWARVTSIFHGGVEGHVISLEVSGLDVSRYTGPGTARSPVSSSALNVQLSHVDVSVGELERLIHQVAPQVKFEGGVRRR